MKFSVDQINDEICVLEEVNTGDIMEVKRECLSEGIVEGNIVILVNGVYELDKDEENKRRLSLRERMNKLKQNNNI